MNKSASKLGKLSAKKRKERGTLSSDNKKAVYSRVFKYDQNVRHAYQEIIQNGESQCAECGSGEQYRLKHITKCEECGAVGNWGEFISKGLCHG